MGGGILSGVFWGTLVSVLVLGTVSLMAPLPEERVSEASPRSAVPQLQTPQADQAPNVSGAKGVETAPTIDPVTDMAADTSGNVAPDASVDDQETLSAVTVPAGSEFRRARPDTAPALPGTDATPDVSAAQAPVVADTVNPPQPQEQAPTRVEASLDAPAAPQPSTEIRAPEAPQVSNEAVLPAPQPAMPASALDETAPVADLSTPQAPSGRVETAEAVEAVAGEDVETPTVAPPAQAINAEAETVAVAQASPAMEADPDLLADAGAAVAVSAQEPADAVRAADPADAPEAVPGQSAPLAQPVPAGAVSDASTAQTADVSGSVAAQTGRRVAGTSPLETAIAAEQETLLAALPESKEANAPVSGAEGELTPRTGDPAQALQNQNLPRADARVPEGTNARVPEGTEPATTSERVAGKSLPPRVSDRAPANPQGIGVRVTPFTERNAAPEDAVAQKTSSEDVAPQLSALARNSAVFDAAQDRPLFSVILIDAGAEGLDRDTLTTFSFPVTFAVDPTAPDAGQAVAAYRRAGFEVLLLADGLPNGATSQDVEVTFGAHLAAFPEAIGMMDVAAGTLGNNREIGAQTLEVLAEDGHGLVLYDAGLNSAKKAADSRNVPAGLIFRTLDAEKERSVRIGRYLDRAAFKAAQDGAVIMVGHSYGETVKALFEWALTNRAGQVTLAPVSAVLNQSR